MTTLAPPKDILTPHLIKHLYGRAPEPEPEEGEVWRDLTTAVVCRNEEKEIADFLGSLVPFSDTIVILDDCSEDSTVDIIKEVRGKTKEVPINIHEMDEPLFMDAENDFREILWTEILPQYQQDWVLTLDVDERMDPRFTAVVDDMMDQPVNGYTFQFWEFWGDREHVRVDGTWNPGQKQQVCMLRWMPQCNYRFVNNPIHCGRVPMNGPGPIVPSGLYVKHYGWSVSKEKMAERFNSYVKRDPQAHQQMMAHYQSILNPNPTLVKFWLEPRGAYLR